ncbi:MAG TPA: hypothetical protein VM166_09495 [Gemmatimonadaceae bacterium]|nr:hypothetical protein [Gemmatimonadaceae bacterium]
MSALIASRSEVSLLSFLVERARAASLPRLSIDTVVGTLCIALAVTFKPSAWLVLASAGLFLLSYGEWGLLDRMRRSEGPAANKWLLGLLDMLCALMTALLMTAIAAMLLGMWAFALGTWIS